MLHAMGKAVSEGMGIGLGSLGWYFSAMGEAVSEGMGISRMFVQYC